jgi:hypothetical protein
VKTNPNLLIELLEMEEMLLEAGLISISDVVRKEESVEQKLDRTSKIIKNLLVEI